MFFKYNNKRTNRGFSLVEMLVAVGIFMSIMTIAISSLISIVNANKRAQSIKNTIDGVTFAIEETSRDMRSGNEYKCSTDSGLSFTNDTTICTGDNVNAIQYTSNSGTGAIITYIFNGKKVNPQPGDQGILVKKIGGTSAVDLVSQDSGVNITDMKFYVIGADNESNPDISKRTQPRVIITASGLIATKGSADTTFNMQTSISQRMRR